MVHYTSVLRACLLGSCAASIVPSDTNMDRRSVQVSTDKTLYCGVFGSGAKDTMATLEHDLVSGKHKKRVWTIGPGECNRVHCYQTTGIYVCNASDAKSTLKISGSLIGQGVRCVHDNCCRDDYNGPIYNKGLSGQKFFRNGGLSYNVAIAYGNCKDPVNIRPSNAEGWGINPVCKGGVMVPDVVSCV